MSANDNDNPTPRVLAEAARGRAQPRVQNIPIRTLEGARIRALFPPFTRIVGADYEAMERRRASPDLCAMLHDAKIRQHRRRWRHERENWTVEDCLWRDGEE